jgi:hypothetical protein
MRLSRICVAKYGDLLSKAYLKENPIISRVLSFFIYKESKKTKAKAKEAINPI